MDVSTQIDGFDVVQAMASYWEPPQRNKYWISMTTEVGLKYLHSDGELSFSAEWFSSMDRVKKAINTWKGKHGKSDNG